MNPVAEEVNKRNRVSGLVYMYTVDGEGVVDRKYYNCLLRITVKVHFILPRV